ncbi:hypothetical protein H4R19_000806 [Coemansia spiralis]|nr:hypothetical protein H4R19_000806 [Coemansia spiralis]
MSPEASSSDILVQDCVDFLPEQQASPRAQTRCRASLNKCGCTSYDDVRVLLRAIDLHSATSNARVNRDKTEVLPIGNPDFALPFAVSPDPVRYLGILFTKSGLPTSAMECALEAGINKRIQNWSHRSLSMLGRVLLANSSLLPAALWSIDFKRIPPARTTQDPCLWYAIRVWCDLHGQAKGAEALELLDTPPERHRITTRYRRRTTTRAAMSDLVPTTLACVRELAGRAAEGDLRCARAHLLFQLDVEEGRVELRPEAAAILRAPADALAPEHIRSKLVLVGAPLADYNPRAARTHLRSPD